MINQFFFFLLTFSLQLYAMDATIISRDKAINQFIGFYHQSPNLKVSDRFVDAIKKCSGTEIIDLKLLDSLPLHLSIIDFMNNNSNDGGYHELINLLSNYKQNAPASLLLYLIHINTKIWDSPENMSTLLMSLKKALPILTTSIWKEDLKKLILRKKTHPKYLRAKIDFDILEKIMNEEDAIEGMTTALEAIWNNDHSQSAINWIHIVSEVYNTHSIGNIQKREKIENIFYGFLSSKSPQKDPNKLIDFLIPFIRIGFLDLDEFEKSNFENIMQCKDFILANRNAKMHFRTLRTFIPSIFEKEVENISNGLKRFLSFLFTTYKWGSRLECLEYISAKYPFTLKDIIETNGITIDFSLMEALFNAKENSHFLILFKEKILISYHSYMAQVKDQQAQLDYYNVVNLIHNLKKLAIFDEIKADLIHDISLCLPLNDLISFFYANMHPNDEEFISLIFDKYFKLDRDDKYPIDILKFVKYLISNGYPLYNFSKYAGYFSRDVKLQEFGYYLGGIYQVDALKVAPDKHYKTHSQRNLSHAHLMLRPLSAFENARANEETPSCSICMESLNTINGLLYKNPGLCGVNGFEPEKPHQVQCLRCFHQTVEDQFVKDSQGKILKIDNELLIEDSAPLLQCFECQTPVSVHFLQALNIPNAICDKLRIDRTRKRELEGKALFLCCKTKGCFGGAEVALGNAIRFDCEICKQSCDLYRHVEELDASAKEQLLQNGFKQCPYTDCRLFIEKNQGCHHMKCGFCNYEFHWETMQAYKVYCPKKGCGHSFSAGVEHSSNRVENVQCGSCGHKFKWDDAKPVHHLKEKRRK